ncbi:MAG: methylated-DNA--[protein]-cysteine S-methyltransferase [Terrimicrobiaceae bacterium]|nr:methylated-DNA--[protein]-cysteine S-methyltransferase [Terrimicrobiaceae bacterium]
MNRDRQDYDRIERAIAHLDAHWPDQPALGELAASAGLSESHFHRLFARWAGVGPMQFLRHLTKEEARRRLRDGMSVLDTALDVGLSGPGRLHDLLVTCDAVTPGETRRGGEGVALRHGFAPTPFGDCLLAQTPRGICALEFVNGRAPAQMLAALRREWPRARFVEDAPGARALAAAVFAPVRESPRLHLRGTNFQLKVWRALLAIPSGALATYGGVAGAIGAPTASRAVGGAVGANPISFLIPCHRVIRATGAFGHYRWGAARKQALCGWEAARHERG